MPKTQEEWQAWQRSLGVPIVTESMGALVELSEVIERIAQEKARGRGLIAMFPLPSHPIDYEPLDVLWQVEGEAEPRQRISPRVQLLFVSPDPHPDLVDPATITFTPTDALAMVKQWQGFAHGVQTVGPITDLRAALMTLPEVDALVDHGIPPASPGTVPGTLVILVVARGSFQMYPPFRDSKPIPFVATYAVFDSRAGHGFRSGASPRDIVLPEWAVSLPGEADQEVSTP
jgi:hypothetical protein